MKRLKKLNLNIQLVAVFFAAVLLLSLVHFFLYSHLLKTMQREEDVINTQRIENATAKVDAVLLEGEKAALEILISSTYQAMAGIPVDEYTLAVMHTEAAAVLDEVPHVFRWFILMEGNEQLITSNGYCEPETYFEGLCISDRYTQKYWDQRFETTTGKYYYPAAEYTYRDSRGKFETKTLMPMSFRSYYDRQLMVVLLWDIEEICREDTYLETGVSLFSEDETCIYTAQDTPKLENLPQINGEMTVGDEEYRLYMHETKAGPVCVKLQRESEAASLLENNFLLCVVVAAAALIVIALLVPTIVRMLLTPVNKMVSLVRQHANPQEHTDLHAVSQELEEIIRSREQQAADLAQKNAALSEYRLHSRLKNVYVDFKVPENQEEGNAYLIFIQVRYQEKCLESFEVSRSELEKCLQEMMASTLQQLFKTVMIFQLEPGKFAARVALQPGDEDIKTAMTGFMRRLEQEQEFAYFTVVQSEALTKENDLAQTYDAIRSGARMGKIQNKSQLLVLPIKKKDIAFRYQKADSQKLDELIRQKKIPQAVLVAEKILGENAQMHISYAQMEELCVSIVNTVTYAAAETQQGSHQAVSASKVYNVLATGCATLQDYLQVVTDLIRSVEISREGRPDTEDQLLDRIHLYVQENYHREFSGEEMAADLWVSRSYLSSYYKNKTGKNLSDSIQQYRIQKAEELLKDPEVKIGDVGPMVGISSNNTFLRQFRKYTGMTPKEYRQQGTAEQ